MSTQNNFLIFSDLHIHNYKRFSKNNGKDRLYNCLNILSELYTKASKTDSDILFCGDLFDSSSLLPTIVVNSTLAVLKSLEKAYPNVKFIAISGNHDHSSKNIQGKPNDHALKYLQIALDNFIVLDNKKDTMYKYDNVNIYGVPYYESSQDFSDAVNLILDGIGKSKDDKIKILLTHQTPKGIMDGLIDYDFDPNSDEFNHFDYIFNGHIHKRFEHTDTRITVGNPMHKDLDDAGEIKGYYQLSLENKKLEFIPLDKHYVEILLLDGSKNDYDENVYKNKYVIFQPKVSKKQTDNTTGLGDTTNPKDVVKSYWKVNDPKKSFDLLKTGLQFIT